MMKHIFLNSILTIILTATYSQHSVGYQIEGTLKGLEKDTLIYLVLNETRDTIAFTQSKNAKFTFKGSLPTSVEWASVRIAKSKKWPTFFLENCRINIEGQVGEWEKATVVGSKETEILNQLRQMVNPLRQKMDSAVEISSGEKEIAELDKQMFVLKVRFIEQHPNSAYTAWLIRNTSQFDYKRKQLEFYKLSPEVQNSNFGTALWMNIKEIQLRNSIKPEAISPDFKLKTLDGKIVSINEIIKNNKLTLIDFWASWCAPCRKFTPELRKIYNEFHQMGFTIISISSDQNKEAWQKAVATDSMKWLNAVPLSGFESPLEIFDIKVLPSMMLLDKDGRIVAFESPESSLGSFGFNSHTLSNKREYLYKKIRELLEN
jgi:thiol-disulfide isomerase/thioredoxin